MVVDEVQSDAEIAPTHVILHKFSLDDAGTTTVYQPCHVCLIATVTFHCPAGRPLLPGRSFSPNQPHYYCLLHATIYTQHARVEPFDHLAAWLLKHSTQSCTDRQQCKASRHLQGSSCSRHFSCSGWPRAPTTAGGGSSPAAPTSRARR